MGGINPTVDSQRQSIHRRINCIDHTLQFGGLVSDEMKYGTKDFAFKAVHVGNFKRHWREEMSIGCASAQFSPAKKAATMLHLLLVRVEHSNRIGNQCIGRIILAA